MRCSTLPIFITATIVSSIALNKPAEAAKLIGISWTGDVYEIDSITGSGSLIGNSGFYATNSLAQTSSGHLISSSFGISDNTATIVDIDPITGVGNSEAIFNNSGEFGSSLRGLAFSSENILYAIDHGGQPQRITGIPDELYRLDIATGTIDLVGITRFDGIQGLAFGNDEILYAWDIFSGLLTIDLSTGIATDINSLQGGNPGIQTIAFDANGMLFGAGDALYSIDLETGSFDLIGTGGYSDLRGIEFISEDIPESSSIISLGALASVGLFTLWQKLKESKKLNR